MWWGRPERSNGQYRYGLASVRSSGQSTTGAVETIAPGRPEEAIRSSGSRASRGDGQRILVPIDDSEVAAVALEHTLVRFNDAKITALHVIDADEPDDSPRHRMLKGSFEERWATGEERADRVVKDARDRADEHGAALTTAITRGQPGRVIGEYAEENGIDRIVMGSHNRSGIERLLLGSVTESVQRRSAVPVLVVCESEETGRDTADGT